VTDRPEEYVLTLTNAEAVVLFELVSRFRTTDVLEFEDRAEAQALWNLCCLLEKQLVEPFDPNFKMLLHAARDELRPLDTKS
jgi:hypothetical protein